MSDRKSKEVESRGSILSFANCILIAVLLSPWLHLLTLFLAGYGKLWHLGASATISNCFACAYTIYAGRRGFFRHRQWAYCFAILGTFIGCSAFMRKAFSMLGVSIGQLKVDHLALWVTSQYVAALFLHVSAAIAVVFLSSRGKKRG